MIRDRYITAIVLILLAFPVLRAQEGWDVPFIEEDILFDGIPDEALWDQVTPFPMLMFLPNNGQKPDQESIIKLYNNSEYFYLGAQMLVSDPDHIQAIGKKRDFNSMTCDWIGISLDTYNDKENSMLFFTNPNGVRWDATVGNDGVSEDESQSALDVNWNTFWDVRTHISEEGWYAEIRIPVSSLRFHESEGKTIMGISIFRWIPALNKSFIFPPTPYDWGDMSNLKPSVFAEAILKGLNPQKPLYISPYVLTAFEQYNELNVAETGYEYQKEPVFEPGLDIKYGINPNTTLDLTVNTDFAQVEADDQQFNLSRFSLVFPEKRPFFLERSAIFDFGLGGPNTLFYSRRIGLWEGNPVRIWGGARLNSRIGGWDLGILDMQTAGYDDLPSENFGVFRVKRKTFNANSYVGGMLTSRIGVDGSYNMAYGVDGVIRLLRDEYLTLRWAQTYIDTVETQAASLDPTRVYIGWERRKREGFSYNLFYTRSGTDFEPGIGLEIFQDYWATVLIPRYDWISPEQSSLQNHYIDLSYYNVNDVVTNELLIMYAGPGWTWANKKGWYGSVRGIYNREFLQEDFELDDPVIVPSGRYSYVSSVLSLGTPMSRRLSAILMLEGGEYYDGTRISPSLTPSLHLGASLELGGFYRFDHVSFPDRDQELNNHIAGLRALYMLSTKISFSAFVQYNTAIRKVISNFRFRYNPKEGTDLYLVFNEGRNTWPDREVPALPIYDQRNLTLKFTYTFAHQLVR